MPTGKIPHCVATLNPKLRDNHYPNKELTGVGVAFKLACAVLEALKIESPEMQRDMTPLLDLVALGTITDVGTLLGENRTLVRHGLKEIRMGRRLGVRALCLFAGVQPAEVTSTDVVLRIAPKLNSLGRLADASIGVALLLAEDKKTIEEILCHVDQVNRERQQIEAQVFHDVNKVIVEQPKIIEQAAIVLSSANWHARIIPIVASRLAKTYNKPVVIISDQHGIGRGSLRTIGSFPLLGILQKCSSLFISYGGHDFAAGIVIQSEKIEDFKKKFIHLVHSSIKKEEHFCNIPNNPKHTQHLSLIHI